MSYNYYASGVVSGGTFCATRVAAAVRRGILPPAKTLQCTDCEKTATEYDHRDYNFPLQVDPVCRGCNVRRGPAIRKVWERQDLLRTLKRHCNGTVVPWAREFCLAHLDGRIQDIEAATNGSITRHELRPDLYPVEAA